jgi:hypothetical protein
LLFTVLPVVQPIFNRPSRSTRYYYRNMTSWIPGFGGKSKKEKQADEAKAWHESHLGTGDEFFTHTRSAVEDSGSFKLTDVRPRPKEADRGGSRLVKIPKGKYEKPPQVSDSQHHVSRQIG